MCFDCGNSTHKEVVEIKPAYCDKCKYYTYQVEVNRASNDRCFHPYICKKKLWFEPNPIREGYWNTWTESGNCWRLNADNNCKFFEKK